MSGLRFNRVHAVCQYLRNSPKVCKRCPAWERTPPYGKSQRFCYGMAQEVINIAVHGNPWGKGIKRKSVAKWRKRFNRE